MAPAQVQLYNKKRLRILRSHFTEFLFGKLVFCASSVLSFGCIKNGPRENSSPALARGTARTNRGVSQSPSLCVWRILSHAQTSVRAASASERRGPDRNPDAFRASMPLRQPFAECGGDCEGELERSRAARFCTGVTKSCRSATEPPQRDGQQRNLREERRRGWGRGKAAAAVAGLLFRGRQAPFRCCGAVPVGGGRGGGVFWKLIKQRVRRRPVKWSRRAGAIPAARPAAARRGNQRRRLGDFAGRTDFRDHPRVLSLASSLCAP